MNKLNASVLPLVGISVLLSMSAMIAVVAHWPDRGARVVTLAAARPAATHVQNVRIVMHDPGCHWIQTASGLKRTLTVNGPVRLTNQDETTIRVVGATGTQLDKVGSALRLARGTYHITMVGQAPDDNHLKLVVR